MPTNTNTYPLTPTLKRKEKSLSIHFLCKYHIVIYSVQITLRSSPFRYRPNTVQTVDRCVKFGRTVAHERKTEQQQK